MPLTKQVFQLIKAHFDAKFIFIFNKYKARYGTKL